MLTQWVSLGIGAILILFTALYVAAEFSLITVDRATVSRQAAAGDPRAASLSYGLRTLSTQLSGAQVGISLTTLALGFVMQPALADLLAVPLRSVGLAGAAGTSASVVIALIVTNMLSMVFGELVPKNIAIAEPMGTAKAVVRASRISAVVFKPLIWLLNGSANGVLRMFNIEPQEELRSARSPEELSSLVIRSAELGTLEDRTAGLLARSISFSGKTAADVLTPRPRVRFIKSTESATEIITAAAETGHSRFPVIGTDSDDVLGLVHLKRAVSIPRDQRATVPVSALTSEVPVVPETMPLDSLLDLLRERGFQMAVVADEYGGTAGVLTLEDVVEELVGEITDEHDPTANRAERLPDGTWLLPGIVRPDEVLEITGVALPESGDYETIAGLVLARLGRLADVGDFAVVEATVRHTAALGARLGTVQAGLGAPPPPPEAPPREALPREALPREALPREALPREALPREALPLEAQPHAQPPHAQQPHALPAHAQPPAAPTADPNPTAPGDVVEEDPLDAPESDSDDPAVGRPRRGRHPATQSAESILPDDENDLPRAALVRLDVMTMSGHRIEALQLSAIGLRDEAES